MSDKSTASSTGIGTFTAIGVSISVWISMSLNHNIWWAIFHGLLGWFYVIYRASVGY